MENTYIPTNKEAEFVSKLLNIQPNDIAYMFFSDKNVDYINSNVIEQVKKITLEKNGKSMRIQPQKRNLVITVMRFVYFKNIQNRCDAKEELTLLNEKVLNLMVPAIIKELEAQMRYLNDYNKMINPLSLPYNDSIKMGY